MNFSIYKILFNGIICKTIKHKETEQHKIPSHEDNDVRGSPHTWGYVHQNLVTFSINNHHKKSYIPHHGDVLSFHFSQFLIKSGRNLTLTTPILI